MPTIDIEMQKSISAELSARKHSLREKKQEIEKLLKSYAERTGFPVDELNRLRAERQAERRRLREIRADNAAQVTNEEDVAFRQAVVRQDEALILPATPMLFTLTQPEDIFLSGDHTQPVDFDKHVEPGNSFANVRINVHTGDDTVKLLFPFTWINPNQSPLSLIDIGTMLRLHGSIQADSDTGFPSGETVQIQLIATLNMVVNGVERPLGGNTLQNVAFVSATGGIIIFGDPAIDSKSFVALPVGLGADSLIVPGGATIVFGVGFKVQYEAGDEDANLVQVDLRVGCGSFHVQVLAS